MKRITGLIFAFTAFASLIGGSAFADDTVQATPFPHGAELRAPDVDPQSAYPDVERPLECDVDFNVHARRLEAPEHQPERSEGYHFAGEIMSEVASIQAEWPGRVSVACAGRSVRRRPIWQISISDPTYPITKRVLVYAQLHALEWLGPEVILELVRELSEHPTSGVEVVLMPIVNPDGRLWVESDLLAGRTNVYRRANAHGVDLNRDFEVNREITSFWSRFPISRRYYYTSPAPLSQPESQVLDSVAATGFDVTISLHAFGGYIYYPWAGSAELPEDNDRIVELAQVMGAAQRHGSYKIVQLGRWAFWFKAHGAEIDQMYGRHGALSFLIELSESGLSLWDPSTWSDYFRWYNPREPQRHVEQGTDAVLALVRRLSWEAMTEQGQ